MSIFFNTFAGQYVRVITKVSTRSIVEDEAGVVDRSTQLILEGFLLDIDEDYYYLGKNSDEIDGSVRKADVVAVEVFEKRDEHDEMLDDFAIPSSKNAIQ